METKTLALACLLIPFGASSAATIFSTNFESDTVGSAPSQFTTSNTANTTILISGTYNATNGNTLLLSDAANNGNPNINRVLGGTYSNYIYSYDYLIGTGGDIQRTEFRNGGTKTIDIRLDGNTLKLVDNIATGTTLISTSLASISGWNASGFNTYSFEVDDSTDTIITRVNGVQAFVYTSSSAIDLQASQFQINVGYSTANNNSGYFDNISFVAIPEPSTGLISLLALGLTTRRKRA